MLFKLPKTLVPALGALALLPALLSSAGALADSSASLSVELAAGEAPGEVIFSLHNEGEASVAVLRSDTPLEATLAVDAFEVRSATAKVGSPEAARALYTGTVFKRAEPTAADFVTIAPGESVSALIDLESYYDVATAGTYRIDYRGEFHHAPSLKWLDREDTAMAGAGLSTSALHVRGPDMALEPGLATFLRARPPQFESCSAAQQNILVEATTAAEGIADEALSSLRGLAEADRPGSPRYERWFGDYDPARYARVSDNFTRISGALADEVMNYSCACDPRFADAFAYVRPAFPYDVFMCNAFFQADVLGTDSRAGTIIHELSHFTILGGTDDIAYGQQLAGALAQDSPEDAVNNADSHEYFAENTPALPMEGTGGGGWRPPPIPSRRACPTAAS